MTVMLSMKAERHLLPLSGTKLHIDFYVQIVQRPAREQREREPLTLVCVVDRSGSMSGEKIKTARKAIQAVIERLEERDQIAVVIFDDEVQVIQPLVQMTKSRKSAIREVLSTIEARGSTALHEGWLSGCNAIADSVKPKQGLARCFLLTDGQANIGITDPETIAMQAGGIRREAGIGTSTFGIGTDYNEALLGPMAVAGGGQFHHVRSTKEIAAAFVGELGSLLSVDASQIRLEVEYEVGVEHEMVSTYWSASQPGETPRQIITIGDGRGGEEFHIVMGLNFPVQQQRDHVCVRARTLWIEDGEERKGNWQEITFSYADGSHYEQEQVDVQVVRQVALQKADKARIHSIGSNKRGDYTSARMQMEEAVAYVEYAMQQAPPDEIGALVEEQQSLEIFKQQVVSSAMPAVPAKEVYYQAQRRSRSQADHRTYNVDDTSASHEQKDQTVKPQAQKGIIPNFLKRRKESKEKEQGR